MIDDAFRKFAVKTQLDNVCKILKAKIEYRDIIDTHGRKSKLISIYYREDV